MLGINDRIYALYRKYHLPTTPFRLNVQVRSVSRKKECWVCFVPGNVPRGALFRRGILPKEGKVIIYPFDSLQWIVSDTKQTLHNIDIIYRDAIKRMKVAVRQGYALNILGISLGNALALRTAADIRIPIHHLISLVGGAELGNCAWESVLTSSIARQSGCASKKEYEQRLSCFSALQYVKRIRAQHVTLRFGTRDLLIPFYQGQLLAKAFQQRAKATPMRLDIKVYRGADHCSALGLYSLECLAKRHFLRHRQTAYPIAH